MNKIYLLTIKLDLKNEYDVINKLFSTKEEAEKFEEDYIKNKLREIFGFENYNDAINDCDEFPDSNGEEYFSCDIVEYELKDGVRKDTLPF